VSNPSRRKGSEAEQLVADYITERGYRAERRHLAGANDKGDIVIFSRPELVIEVKAAQTLSLGAWCVELEREIVNAGGQTGVLVVKRKGSRDPANWFAVQPFERWLDDYLKEPF
jgi:hypothetical protein